MIRLWVTDAPTPKRNVLGEGLPDRPLRPNWSAPVVVLSNTSFCLYPKVSPTVTPRSFCQLLCILQPKAGIKCVGVHFLGNRHRLLCFGLRNVPENIAQGDTQRKVPVQQRWRLTAKRWTVPCYLQMYCSSNFRPSPPTGSLVLK